MSVGAGLVTMLGSAVGYARAQHGLEVNVGQLPPAVRKTVASPDQPRGRVSRRPAPLDVRSPRPPTRLRVPSLLVDAPVVSVGVDRHGSLGIPSDPGKVGWWAGSATPGAPAGATVLVGHVDSATAGPGALFLLRELALGRTIRVNAGRATYSYVVAAVRTVPKADLPSLGVLHPLGPRRLLIVTCGGPFDRSTRRYLDNLVVYARPAPRR